MASKAHCFYCFESISASFENRDAPALETIVKSYEIFAARRRSGAPAADDATGPAGPNIQTLDDSSSSETEDVEEGTEDGLSSQKKTYPKLPSISRLQASSSSSRSSAASTPSMLSANSSQSQLTTASSSTSIDSRPSYSSRVLITESYPMFVTWNTISRSGHHSLRGCIGTFDPLPLAAGLQTYALTSAFDDVRFSPIPATLITSLSCAITLLANFEPCADAFDWALGTHGLRISFHVKGRRHSATYLPDVATEQGWNKEETLESLMRKAGWSGGASGQGIAKRISRGASKSQEDGKGACKPWEEVSDFRAIRYTGLRADATYAEWKEWQGWANGQK